MLAVIKTGGKQYTVAEDQTIRLGKLVAKPGEIVTFPVMLLGGESPSIGTPTVSGALVAAEVVTHTRGETEFDLHDNVLWRDRVSIEGRLTGCLHGCSLP